MIIELPQVGESISEGVIGKWLKQVGDTVEKFDPLVEIVTDKVAMELPSPISGILKQIIVNEGDTVPIGAEIAYIEPPEEFKTAEPIIKPTGSESSSIGTTGELLKNTTPVGPTGSGSSITITESEESNPPLESSILPHQYLSPAVIRLAQQNNINLSEMIGTGRNNRITRKDVQKIIDSTPHQVKKNTNTSLGTLASDQYKLEVTPIRKITASNMAKSANLIPQAWTLTEVDVSGMVNLRQSLKENFLKQEGINITYLPFVIKAVAQSLKTNLLLNSSWGKDHIVMKKRINIGIAAATENGLVVPVIHDADTLSVSGLAHKIDDLTKKSRDGMLTIDAVSGGTFTVNNTGVLGSIASQPLVNYPQAAIMTTEAIIRRPVVIGDGIAIRSMMNLCLSFDHRIMDGKEAGGFNHDVKQTLESINENTPIY